MRIAIFTVMAAIATCGNVLAVDQAKIAQFHSVVAAAMEKEGIRGAAYAFRGPVSSCQRMNATADNTTPALILSSVYRA